MCSHHKLLQANLVKLAQRADALPHASMDPYAPLLDAEDRFYSVNLLKELDAHIQAKPEAVEGEGPRIDVILQLMQQEAMSNPAIQADASLEPCAECQSNGIPGAVCRRQLNHTAAASDSEAQTVRVRACGFGFWRWELIFFLPPCRLCRTTLQRTSSRLGHSS